MDARITRTALLAAVLLVSMGARQRTANFIVETADANLAQQVAQAAEKFRHDLAIEWLGQEMPNWAQPCVMTVQAGSHLGAGGATTFVFDRGEVFGWRMSIQGSPERLLDSVLPHEITHMVFASRFREPLPRWADEGGATSVEHAGEKNKHRQMLNQFLRTGRGIAFNQMFAMTEYPQDIMPLYAQGYSLAEFLIQTGGRRKFVEFLGDGLKSDDWTGAVQRHYGTQDLGALQNTWLAWVQQGSPLLKSPNATPAAAAEMLAANQRKPRPEPNLIYRIRDKQLPATPTAGLVPVHFPAAATSAAPVVVASAASGLPNPPPAERIATTVPLQPPIALPTAGWHLPGMPPPAAIASPSTPPSIGPFRAQVTHPQAMEQPRQTVVR
jgi:hypothetical protein